MSPMELYVRFMASLAVGLLGLGLMLKTLLETVFHEWDAVRDLRGLVRGWHRSPVDSVRAEDILIELERGRRERRVAGGDVLDRRREALRDMREAESRLAAPSAEPV